MTDKSKTYVTSADKYPVRIYATDGGGKFPVHAAFLKDGVWRQYSFTEAGCHWGAMERHPLDLIEVKPEFTAWLNIYADHMSALYPDREMADRHARSGRFACIEVKYHEKEGL